MSAAGQRRGQGFSQPVTASFAFVRPRWSLPLVVQVGRCRFLAAVSFSCQPRRLDRFSSNNLSTGGRSNLCSYCCTCPSTEWLVRGRKGQHEESLQCSRSGGAQRKGCQRKSQPPASHLWSAQFQLSAGLAPEVSGSRRVEQTPGKNFLAVSFAAGKSVVR